MKFFLKITIILFLLFIIGWIACWIYISKSITNILNENYANNNICYSTYLGKRCFKFSKAVQSGFPTKISTQLIQFEEDLIQQHAIYKDPISITYHVAQNKLTLEYAGKILSKSKINDKYDLLTNIQQFKIEFATKNTMRFLSSIITFNTPKQKLNDLLIFHIKSSTKDLSILRLSDNQKIFHKNKDKLKVKLLTNLNQIKQYLSNKKYLYNTTSVPNIDLSYKTDIQDITNKDIDLPPLFVLFPFILSEQNTTGKMDLSIEQSPDKKNAESKIKLHSDISNNFIHASDLKIQYSKKPAKEVNTLKEKIKSKGKIFIKTGAIEKLHRLYNKALIKYDLLKVLDKHQVANKINNIFINKKQFHLENVENKSYDFGLKGNITQSLDFNNYITKEIEYFKINSEDTGFSISFKPYTSTKSYNQMIQKITGQIVLNNYPLLIEHFSPSIIEVISQVKHNDHFKNPCHVDALKLFFKTISNKADDKNISLDYSFNADEKKQFKLAGKKIDKLTKIYQLSLLNILKKEKGDNVDDLLPIFQNIFPNSIQDKEQLLKLMQYKIHESSIKPKK